MKLFRSAAPSLVTLLFAVTGCSSKSSDSGSSEDQFRQSVASGMVVTLSAKIVEWQTAAEDLQKAAPVPTGRGWSATDDAASIAATKAAWQRVRTAYEQIEGALAPLFPDLDFSVDARYDDFLTQLGRAGDDNPFDDQKVTGQHAIERILYADSIPPYVVTFEQALPGYAAAAFPATEQEASDFKNKLCAKLVSDIASLNGGAKLANLDVGGAFSGLTSLMNEQKEKVNKASTQEEESRYSQRTLADLRDNLTGTAKVFELFRPWLASHSSADPANDGTTVYTNVQAGFHTLDTLYAQYPGAAVPRPPSGWSSIDPSPADLATDFGKLYSGVIGAVDPLAPGSVVGQMNEAARLLGLEQLTEQP